MEKRSRTFRSALKSCLLVALAATTVNVYAGWFDSPTVYVGNPHRPNIVWQPSYTRCGCWNHGYYVKFMRQPTCGDVCWTQGHYRVRYYRVVNPMPDSFYPGYAM